MGEIMEEGKFGYNWDEQPEDLTMCGREERAFLSQIKMLEREVEHWKTKALAKEKPPTAEIQGFCVSLAQEEIQGHYYVSLVSEYPHERVLNAEEADELATELMKRVDWIRGRQ